jgi:hypothetical protein
MTIRCAVEILDRHTGELVGFEDTSSVWLEDGIAIPYIWEDGNFACDCNRALFWNRAQGIEIEEDPPCGPLRGSGRYAVRLTRLDTGEILLDELQ